MFAYLHADFPYPKKYAQAKNNHLPGHFSSTVSRKIITSYSGSDIDDGSDIDVCCCEYVCRKSKILQKKLLKKCKSYFDNDIQGNDENFRNDSLHDNFNGKNFEHADYSFVQNRFTSVLSCKLQISQCTPSKLNERFVENKNDTL